MAPIHLREISSDGVLLPGDVAAELYAARVERGVDLRAVSAELRIHYDHLLAIEEGRFSDLPGPAYVIGFLRSYAGYLDLDANLLVQRFKAETTEFEPRQDLNALEPYDEGGVPTGALILLALALVVGAYGGWYYVVNLDEVAIERIPEVPDRMIAALAPEPDAAMAAPNETAEPEPAPEPGEAEPMAAAPAAPVDQASAPETPVPVSPVPVSPVPVSTAPVSPVPVSVATTPEIPVVLSEEPFDAILAAAIDQNPVDQVEPAPVSLPVSAPESLPVSLPESLPVSLPVSAIEAAPAPEPTVAEPLDTAMLQPVIPAPVIESSDYLPREFGQANAGSTIILRAREESWVQVTGANNELLLTRILRPGDVYHVPDRAGLMLMTGNAGGIEILVGGILAPSLGEIGKVRRQVALDPEKLLAGTANEP